MWNDKYNISFDGMTTDVSVGTTADYAYDLYQKKKQQIADLEYECKLLVDKYHSEMCYSRIPPQFRQDIINNMFGKDANLAHQTRNSFLKLVFSEEFLKKHKITFRYSQWHGYERTGVSIILDIVDTNFYYLVEIPFPENVKKDETKEYLMGRVKFRADKIEKSKWDNFVKKWNSVQMPTYDWKECFEAIEADVANGCKASQ